MSRDLFSIFSAGPFIIMPVHVYYRNYTFEWREVKKKNSSDNATLYYDTYYNSISVFLLETINLEMILYYYYANLCILSDLLIVVSSIRFRLGRGSDTHTHTYTIGILPNTLMCTYIHYKYVYVHFAALLFRK